MDEQPVALTPRQRLDRMIHGFELAEAVRAAARLGVADMLTNGPQPITTLAAGCGAKPALLHRLLRLLASVGVFAEVEPGVFTLTPEAELIVDAPGSMRWSAIFWGELGTLAWRDLAGVVRTGQTGYQLATGMREWEYYAKNPEAGALFYAPGGRSNPASFDAIVAAYDFPETGIGVDVGGGRGELLAAILRRRPGLRGVLLDTTHVVAEARGVLDDAGVADRCELVGGDFFQGVPRGGNLYVLKGVLHDWDDEPAGIIVRNCVQAMGGQSTLLVIENMTPSGTAAQTSDWYQAARADVNMMAWTGGKNRTSSRQVVDSASCLAVQVNFAKKGGASRARIRRARGKPTMWSTPARSQATALFTAECSPESAIASTGLGWLSEAGPIFAPVCQISLFPFETWRRLLGRQVYAGAIGTGAYAHPAGHHGLREAIARHIGVSRGVQASPEDIVITNGTPAPTESQWLALSLDAGGHRFATAARVC